MAFFVSILKESTMSQTQLGAQMYTLRDHLKTPADIAATCKKVSDMGYRGIQVSGFGEIEVSELVKILKDHGLTCGATHASLDQMKNVNQCVEYHQALECQYTAIGGFWPQENHYLSATWIAFAKEFSDVVAQLANHGITAGYHNHSHEFLKCVDTGKTAYETLIEHTSDNVWFELDTYWVTHGGGEPSAWLDRVAGRCPVIHVKDMGINHERNQFMCEVGEGNLQWDRIVSASKNADVQWYMVERDSGELDPFDSLEISLKNLQAMGLS